LNTEGESIRESVIQVSLRSVSTDDAELLCELYTAERAFLAPFDPPRPAGFFTVDGQRRELARLERDRAADRRYRFLIEADGHPVGALSLSNIVRGAFRSADLGYFVAEAWNGQGVATRAVRQACAWAFGEGGLHRLQAGTLLANAASQRVLERNGFERIGVAPSYLFIGGAWRDHLLFQRIADG
jgi:[ribosomal protein S5]-alanine N-acetyltransferase